jgi:hypothetical protein
MDRIIDKVDKEVIYLLKFTHLILSKALHILSQLFKVKEVIDTFFTLITGVFLIIALILLRMRVITLVINNIHFLILFIRSLLKADLFLLLLWLLIISLILFLWDLDRPFMLRRISVADYANFEFRIGFGLLLFHHLLLLLHNYFLLDNRGSNFTSLCFKFEYSLQDFRRVKQGNIWQCLFFRA